MSDLQEIEATLRDESSGLRDRIVRDIGNFAVALFGVFESTEGDRLRLGGTGTLVTIADCHYILTAAHVWEKVLRSSREVGITLREHTEHRSLMRTGEIERFGPQVLDTCAEWGPDLAFLRVPPARVGTFNTYKAFYNLTRPRQTAPVADHLETRVLIGTPEALGDFTQTHANLQICGFFTGVDATSQIRGEFDYLDLEVDVSLASVPVKFGGVSGGGLWKVLIFRSASTGEIDWLKVLEGVAFYQSALVSGRRVIRCHGQQSIHTAMVFPTTPGG